MYMEELAPEATSRLLSSSATGGFLQPGPGSASAPRTAFSAQPLQGILVSSRLVRDFVVRQAESVQEELFTRFPKFFTVLDETDVVLNSTSLVARLEMGDSRIAKNQAFRVRQLVDVRPLPELLGYRGGDEEVDVQRNESGSIGSNGSPGSPDSAVPPESEQPPAEPAGESGVEFTIEGASDAISVDSTGADLDTTASDAQSGSTAPNPASSTLAAAPQAPTRLLDLEPIPFAARIPYLSFLDASGAILSNVLTLRGIFRDAGIDPSQDITFYGADGFETALACFAAFLSSGQSFTRYTVMADGLDTFWKKYGSDVVPDGNEKTDGPRDNPDPQGRTKSPKP